MPWRAGPFRRHVRLVSTIVSDPQVTTVSVFGLGYVGCVCAACLASRGHRVVGVDVNPDKVESLRQGRSPVVEEKIGDLTAEVVAAGDLTVTADARAAVLSTDISLVCVGTPSAPGGGLSTTFLEQVTDEIGAALADKDGWHVVVYRSTMVPGTCENLLIPRLESASGKRAGVDFGVCVNPEFLREGTERPGFSRSTQNRCGRDGFAQRRNGAGTVRRPSRPTLPGPHQGRRDDQVRRQQLPRAQGRLRQRDRCDLLVVGAGLACRHGHLPGRHQTEHQPGLSSAGIRLRWLVPAQGRPGAHPHRAAQRRRYSVAGEPARSPTRAICVARSTS